MNLLLCEHIIQMFLRLNVFGFNYYFNYLKLMVMFNMRAKKIEMES